MEENEMSQNGTTAARTENASKIYGSAETEVRAIDGITVEFNSGQLTAIMGPSGSGKSTLMQCVAGLDTLTSGKTFIGDTDLTSLSERQLTLVRRSKVGFIFQGFNLIPTLTAWENITLPISLAGAKADPAWEKEILEVTDLKDRLSHRPSQLSGGQQQRVAVARALLSRPDIMFADEPTGNLDSNTGNEILEFLKKAVNDLQQTIVMVTHDPRAAIFADRLLFLRDGKVVDELMNPTLEEIVKRT